MNALNKMRLICSLCAALLLTLLAAGSAQAQWSGPVYTVNGHPISTVANTPTGTVILDKLFTYNGAPVSPVVIESNGHLDATYNGAWWLGNNVLAYEGIAVSPTITATFTWTGSGTPTSSSYIVSQTAYCGGILESGTSTPFSDGLGDAPVLGSSPFPNVYYATESGTHYVVKSWGTTITVTCSPIYQGGGLGGLSYSATIYPVKVSLSGVTLYNGLDYNLVGVPVIATASAGPATITKCHWNLEAFGSQGWLANYNPSLASNQITLANLAANPITICYPTNFIGNPANNGLSVLGCTLSLSFPDGTSYTGIEAASDTFDVVSPTATISYTDAAINASPMGAHVDFSPINVSVPIPFSGGTCGIAQLATVSRSASTASGVAHSYTCTGALDHQFPLYSWSAAATGSYDDIETQDLTGSGWLSASATDSYVTWLMYKPTATNSIWVPLIAVDWGWSGSALLDGVGNVTSETAAISGIAIDNTNSYLWPTWSSVYSGPGF